HGVRHAAAVEKGDQQIAGESLDYLRAHRKDAVSAWQQALVHADRLDEAAQVLIERLRDPMERSDALSDVQIYANPPLTEMEQIWLERWRNVVSRADVREVIDRVGRIETFGIPPQ